jgi:hypothetical protein
MLTGTLVGFFGVGGGGAGGGEGGGERGGVAGGGEVGGRGERRQDCGRLASKTILCHFFLLYFLFCILAFLLHVLFSATCALFFLSNTCKRKYCTCLHHNSRLATIGRSFACARRKKKDKECE